MKEYFIFDPEYDYLDEALVGYRLEGGQYVPLEVKDRRARSEVLGLDLVDTGETLRLLDPQTGQFLPTAMEEAASRRAADEARRQVEAEAARLREELKRLQQGGTSENLG
ncbi:MAG: hypothetical protein HY314_01610 [Acidobacteria bacterium]|nr:hypothetical protein [Acidobacteriota bacterium]